jgi:hypothetical protein
MLTPGALWLLIVQHCWCMPPVLPQAAGTAASASLPSEFTVARALTHPQFAAIAFTRLLCCQADLPHGQLCDRLRRAGHGRRHRVRRGVASLSARVIGDTTDRTVPSA